MKFEDFPEKLKKTLWEHKKMMGIEGKIRWLYTKDKEPYLVTLVEENNELQVENISPVIKPEDLVKAFIQLQDVLMHWAENETY